jgi:hypothetical protein
MLRRGIGFPVGFAALWLSGLLFDSARASTLSAPSTSQNEARIRSGRSPGKPAYLWIWYGDGKSRPSEDSPSCGGYTPSAYKCDLSSMDDCKRQVLAYLDAWYADFNILFTFSRPPSGDYYTIVVTNDGTWCPREPVDGGIVEGGVAYSSGCNDITGFAGYAFECGANAHDCATLIAHEHAHMVGLEHTNSITDIMNQKVRSTASGFDKEDNAVVDDICDYLTQNSYQRMLSALGPWPGGTKPGPLTAVPDAGAPDTFPSDSAKDPQVGGSVGNPGTGTGVDGGFTVLPGFDAVSRPLLPTVEPPVAKPASSGGGCNLLDTSRIASASLPMAAFAFFTVFWLRLRRLVTRPHRVSARCSQPGHLLP